MGLDRLWVDLIYKKNGSGVFAGDEEAESGQEETVRGPQI